MKTAVYSDEIFLHHDTGGHPENSGRLRAITKRLEGSPLASAISTRKAPAAPLEDLELVHAADYVRVVEEAALSGRHYLHTPDCVLSHDTFAAARHAAGAVVDAVLEVDAGKLDNAFVACRPPGHHAEQLHAMGFCFFNNIAIATQVLTQRLGYERVLIFDFDVHHGNGTQHAFEARKDVLFCSMHQHPATLFPGTGWEEERGTGDGLGYTMNLPLMPGSTDEAYLHTFEQKALPAFESFKPQFVLISAGFDAHQDDPLAGQAMTRAGFDTLITRMKALALEHCQGKLVSVLEGGYDYDALSDCVVSHVGTLQADPQ